MKITRIQFGLFSVVVAFLSCCLFVISSAEMFTDGDYMTGIHASPNHDTPALGILGAVSAAVVVGIAHTIFIVLFVLVARFRRTAIVINKSYFLVDFSRKNLLRISIQIIGYLLSAYWLWDFLRVTDVKFFGSQLLFSVTAILVTWIYVMWGLIFLSRPTPA